LGEHVLITGGAGFIGSHLTRRLLDAGHRVRVLDNLDSQVHGAGAAHSDLGSDVHFIQGDVCDAAAVARALTGVDVVVHLAARVGVGQSMYEIEQYSAVNTHGTGVLLQAILDRPVRKLLVASSMSVYGEGLYRTDSGELVEPDSRSRVALQDHHWDPLAANGETLAAIPTPEFKRPELASIYALGKYDQEQMCLMFGSAYDIPTVALRFFNVYGPGQALSNPYTGVLAIFASRLLNDRPPLIFEDGHQRRDFVSVNDVVEACALAIQRPGADNLAINVGSGTSLSVREVAWRLAEVLDRSHIAPTITGKYRVGDVRHCFADIERARETIGYAPAVSIDDGIAELAAWLEGQAPDDQVDSAAAELAARGLTL
jgi:dTDP-L-rhamnose 4-epimerase